MFLTAAVFILLDALLPAAEAAEVNKTFSELCDFYNESLPGVFWHSVFMAGAVRSAQKNDSANSFGNIRQIKENLNQRCRHSI